jgi:hypothetical protein
MKGRRLISILTVAILVGGLAGAAAAQGLFEDFEDGVADGWTRNVPGDPDVAEHGLVQAVSTPVRPDAGAYVGRIDFGWSCYGPSRPFDATTPTRIAWWFRADGDTGHPSGLAIRFIGTGGEMVKISYHSGQLRYLTGSFHSIVPATTGQWYHIELQDIDWAARTFDIWVDGVLRASAVPFRQPAENVYTLQAYGCPWASGPIYVDDISITTAPAAKDECKLDGWMSLTRSDGSEFRNQGDCIQYVNTGK